MENKIVLITGSSRGLGKAIAMKLSNEGFFVIINCKDSIEQAKEVKKVIEKNKGNAEIIVSDITKKKNCKKMINDIVLNMGK